MTKQKTEKAEEATTSYTIPGLNIKVLELKIVGDSPLIVHKFSEKAKGMIEDKQQKKAKQAKESRNPTAEYEACFHRLPDGSFGIPAVAIKNAAVFACSHIDGLTKVVARGAMHVVEDDCGLVRLSGDEPKMRSDMVRIGMGVSDVRYRPEFSKWSCTFRVRFNSNVITPEQIINVINTAGFASGIGEWRPQRNGSNGMFHVAVGDE